MVTEKRCKCGELHPPITELLVGIPTCRIKCRYQYQTLETTWSEYSAPKPQASAPTIGIWKSWNCNTPWMLLYKYDHLLQLSPSLRWSSKLDSGLQPSKKIPRTQWPVHLPEPANVEREIRNGRFPWCSSRTAKFAARDMRCPNKLCTSSSVRPP